MPVVIPKCFWFLVCTGIYKNDGPFDVMIDITKIEQLHTIPSETEVCYYFNIQGIITILLLLLIASACYNF